MRTRTVFAPGKLERVQHRFDLWRKTRKRCSPIPETLWSSAVELAREHGLHRTAQALRLNYYALKKRFGLITCAPGRPQREATFVELLPPGAVAPSACSIEMENAQSTSGPGRCRPCGSAQQLLEGVMIQIAPQMRILVAVEAVDFRKYAPSIDMRSVFNRR